MKVTERNSAIAVEVSTVDSKQGAVHFRSTKHIHVEKYEVMIGPSKSVRIIHVRMQRIKMLGANQFLLAYSSPPAVLITWSECVQTLARP